jgi:hypothetical protein
VARRRVPATIAKGHITELVDPQASPILRRPGRPKVTATLAGELIKEGLALAAFVDADRVRAHLAVVAPVGGDYLLPPFDRSPDQVVGIGRLSWRRGGLARHGPA